MRGREVIVQKFPEMEKELSEKLPFKNENWEVIDAEDLKYYLNDGDETNFLKCMKDFQGEIPSRMAENLLTMSAQHNLKLAVTAILKRFEGKYLNVREAARRAVQNGHYDIFEALLKAKPEIAHYLILSLCLMLGEPRKGVDDIILEKCLKLILDQIKDVRCTDIADISSGLTAYFDDWFKKIRNQTNEDIIVDDDYRCSVSRIDIVSKQHTTHRRTSEMEVLLYIARNENLNHLLKHPLLSSFLYLKWLMIKPVLYANFVFYGIFYCLLNIYILHMTYCESSPNKNGTQTVNNSSDVVSNNTLIKKSIRSCYLESFLWTCVIVLLYLFTILEIFLFACCRRLHYLMNWENRLQIALIIFTLILLYDAGIWHRVVVVLLSALVLTTLISQHPKISTYFEMFCIIFRVCVCSLLLCMCLITVPFGLTFYILFNSNKHFSNPENSFFKTLIMLFTGEFNSNDIPVDLHPVLSNSVLVLFAFIIIVYFLAIGIVVSNKTLSKAELNGLISRIRLIVYLEDIALGEPFSWFSWFSRGNSCLSRWKPFSFLINKIFLLPHYLENDKIPLIPVEQSGSIIKKPFLKNVEIMTRKKVNRTPRKVHKKSSS